MSWPATLTAWMTYLRQFRRRSAEDGVLLAGLADVQSRATEVFNALNATRTRSEPHVALSYEQVRNAIGRISEVVELVLPPDLNLDLLEERSALRGTLRGIQRQLAKLRLVAGIFLSRKVLPDPMYFKVTHGVRSYRVRGTDTLGSIAAQQLQDRNRWTEVAALNGLTWPFLGEHADYPTSRIVAPGEELFLPVAQPGSVTTSAAPPNPLDLYGVDLDLTTRLGQMTFSRGDAQLIAGVGNIQQAVRHRVLTARGSLALHPNYGSNIYRWIGGEGAPELLRLALFDFMRAVLEDPRIAKIHARTGALDATTLRLTCDALVVGEEQPLRLNVILPAIAGGPA